jgi:hypothetical protein
VKQIINKISEKSSLAANDLSPSLQKNRLRCPSGSVHRTREKEDKQGCYILIKIFALADNFVNSKKTVISIQLYTHKKDSG